MNIIEMSTVSCMEASVRRSEELQATHMPRGASYRLAGVFRSLLALSLALGGWSGVSAQNTVHEGAAASPGAGPQRKMISLVVLSNKYVDLSASSLSKKLDELYPGNFGRPDRWQILSSTALRRASF